MKPLTIRVEDVERGDSWVYTFDSSPVLIGRVESASLLLARPFVSLRHGTFDFDDEMVRFAELDPVTGTYVDGESLVGGEALLADSSELRVGPLRLTVSRERLPGGPLDPTASPFSNQDGGRQPETEMVSTARTTTPTPQSGGTRTYRGQVPSTPALVSTAGLPATQPLPAQPHIDRTQALERPDLNVPRPAVRSTPLPPHPIASRRVGQDREFEDSLRGRRSRSREPVAPWIAGAMVAAIVGGVLAFLLFSH